MADRQRIHELLQAGELNLAEIGRMCGCSRERVRQIYLSDFGNTGRARTLRITDARVRSDLNGLSPTFAMAAGLAKVKGFEVTRTILGDRGEQRTPRRHGRLATGSLIIVNGFTCDASLARHASSTGGTMRYSRHSWIKPLKPDFLIAMQRVPTFPPRDFIIPARELAKISNEHVYIPVERVASYNNHWSLIDYWEYQNAWHLLAADRANATSPSNRESREELSVKT